MISSGSRGCFVGLLFAFFASLVMYSSRNNFFRSLSVLVFAFAIIGIIFVFSNKEVLDRLFNIKGFTYNMSSENSMSRVWIWVQQLKVAVEQPLLLFFLGYGKSAIVGPGESHSQFVKNFIETGVIGSVLFLLLIYIIARKSFRAFLSSKNSFLTGVSAGLFCCTLAMVVISIGAEGFLVVKISEVYWFFVGMTMSVISMEKKKLQIKNT